MRLARRTRGRLRSCTDKSATIPDHQGPFFGGLHDSASSRTKYPRSTSETYSLMLSRIRQNLFYDIEDYTAALDQVPERWAAATNPTESELCAKREATFLRDARLHGPERHHTLGRHFVPHSDYRKSCQAAKATTRLKPTHISLCLGRGRHRFHDKIFSDQRKPSVQSVYSQ